MAAGLSEQLAAIKAVVDDIKSTVDSTSTQISRLLGLCKENMDMTDCVYSAHGLVSAVISIYDTDDWVRGTTVPLAIYDVSVTYTGKNVSTWSMRKR